MRCLESLARVQAARLLLWQALGRRETCQAARARGGGGGLGGWRKLSSPAPGGETHPDQLWVPTASLTPHGAG